MAVYKDRIKQLIQNIMKKILFFGCIAAALLSFVGCEETGNDYEGTNYIYLESEGGKTTLLGTADDPITVNVKLTKALSEDLTLDFVVEGPQNALTVDGNPVTIKAGEKTASFTIAVASVEGLSEITNYTVGLDASAQLPDKVALEAGFSFAVVAIEIPELTTDQLAIIDAYETATGIDLSKYLGVVNVSTVITGTDPDTYEPLAPRTVTGKTIITLSESSTADVPVLKMIANPMGIQDHMYQILRSVTIENDEYWFPEEDAYPSYATLTEAISWSKTSKEMFSMSLDGIKFNSDKSIEYLGDGKDQYDDDITVVPFEYSFSAYDRELSVKIEKDDEWAPDATANPYYHLNCDDITEDLYEGGNWVEASAEISNENLVFTFCTYACSLDGDYTRVVATYTPNN